MGEAKRKAGLEKFDLDEMIKTAGNFARMILVDRQEEALTPCFLFKTGGGEIVMVGIAAGMNDGNEKDAIAENVRQLMLERGATAYSLVTEAWVVNWKKGDPEPQGSLEFHPGRIEVVSAVAFDASGYGQQQMWRIVRNAKGKVTDLPKFKEPLKGDDVLSGRFTHLLNARA